MHQRGWEFHIYTQSYGGILAYCSPISFHFISSLRKCCILAPQALVWFLARWCDTYLIPLNKIEGLEIFGRREDGGQAEEILHTLLGVAFFAVTSWPGESDLQVIFSVYRPTLANIERKDFPL